jgi:hypothetical protein
MKNILKIILFVLTIASCKAQAVVDLSTFNQGNNQGKYFKDLDNDFQIFLGTWEGVMPNNRTFRIHLFKMPKVDFTSSTDAYYKDFIGGSFELIDNANTSNEVVIHNSVKYYPQNNITTNNVMYFASTNGIKGGGIMEDNYGNDGAETFTAQIVFEILDVNASPLQMHWTARRKMMFQGWHLSIPLDIILTKLP